MLSENIFTSKHANGFCFLSEDASTQMQSRLES